MELNLLPQRGPILSVALEGLRLPTLSERLVWASEHGFEGVELLATGEPWGVHAPSVGPTDRTLLKAEMQPFRAVAAQAPHQSTFDVTLVSPSSTIRRASVSEIWSVFRLVESLGGGVVTVRCGVPPVGLSMDRHDANLAECLVTLDRMAGDHNAVVGLLNRDHFHRLSRFDRLMGLQTPHTGIALDVPLALDNGETPETIASFIASWKAEKLVYVRVGGEVRDVTSKPIADALRTYGYEGMLCLTQLSADNRSGESELSQTRTLWQRRLTGEADDDQPNAHP